MRQMCVRLPMAFLPLAGLQGPQELWPQVTWSESASAACASAFILSAGASVCECHHQTQWEELEWSMHTLVRAIGIM